MAKNAKNSKSAKNTKNAQKSTKKTRSTQSTINTESNLKNQPKKWQVVVRLVIVALLVLALGGSLFFGIIASAYSLPVQTSAAQAGDRIDGRPAEEYAGATDDFPLVEAPYAALCTRDGRVLFERGIDQQVAMASTTKIMTAIIALETTALDTPLKVTYGAANTDGTDAGLIEGTTVSLHDALYALLLPSGNDAAVVIAENVSGMESRFVELMNAKAAELGMTATHFVDASGLSAEEHFTTARDYLALVRHCMNNQTFRQIVATATYQIDVQGSLLSFETTDALGDFLTVGDAIGVKTGYTDEAGYCFVGAADFNGIELYTVVFNAPTTDQRFLDTANLLEWGFRHYRTIELINPTQQVAEVAVLSWIDKTAAAHVPAVVSLDVFDLSGAITQDISIDDLERAAVAGQSCGQIVWSQNGEVLTTSKVVATESVPEPNFWEAVGIGWQRFWGIFSDDPGYASTVILLKNELAIPAS